MELHELTTDADGPDLYYILGSDHAGTDLDVGFYAEGVLVDLGGEAPQECKVNLASGLGVVVIDNVNNKVVCAKSFQLADSDYILP